MSGLDDAIARAQQGQKAAEGQQNQFVDQREWFSRESLVLARRFVDSLRAAGYQPLKAERMTFAFDNVSVRVGSWPSRRKRMDCSMSSSSDHVGQCWPMFGEQYVHLTHDTGSDDHAGGEVLGRSVYAGVVYLPASNSLARAIFPGITRQRDRNDWHGASGPQASFADLVRQRECTLRVAQTTGTSDGSSSCRVPLWRQEVETASMPTGPGSYVEDDGWGRTRTVYLPEVMVPVADRFEELLGPAIQVLNGNLEQLDIKWA